VTEKDYQRMVLLLQAHVENLIERVLELEECCERQEARLRAVERATPLTAPPKARPMPASLTSKPRYRP